MPQTPIAIADFFKYNGNLPYIGEKDTAGTMVIPSLNYIKSAGGLFVPVSATDPMPTSLTGRSVTDVPLQNAAAATGNGTPFTPVNGSATLAFEVRGTSASRTVNFEIAGPGGTYMACTVFKVTDPAVSAVQTTGGTDAAPESWQVDVPAGWSFRARISAVAGGNVTVAGKAVI